MGVCIHRQRLADDTNGDWYSLSMSSGSTYTSSGIPVSRSAGYNALKVLSTAGSIAITLQVSDDNTNFYTPYDTDGNSLGNIYSAVTTDIWISLDLPLALYVRFQFAVTGASSTVTAIFMQKETIR